MRAMLELSMRIELSAVGPGSVICFESTQTEKRGIVSAILDYCPSNLEPDFRFGSGSAKCSTCSSLLWHYMSWLQIYFIGYARGVASVDFTVALIGIQDVIFTDSEIDIAVLPVCVVGKVEFGVIALKCNLIYVNDELGLIHVQEEVRAERLNLRLVSKISPKT